MKAITLTQPWATLIAIGAKTIETRSWNTIYRGKLAIHAAKVFPKEAKYMCFQEPFRELLIDRYGFLLGGGIYFGYHKFPLGAVIATCNLIQCVKIKEITTLIRLPKDDFMLISPGPGNELAFGDYTPGRFAWILTEIKPLPEPIPAKGTLGLWEWKNNA